MHRLRAIIKKEFKQLRRDKRMVFVIFFFPVFLLTVFGFAVNFDVENIELAVYSQENSEASRSLVNSIASSSYFTVTKHLNSYGEAVDVLDNKDAQVVLVIPRGFTEKLYSAKEPVRLQYLIDGLDANTASIIQNYVVAATSAYNINIQAEQLARSGISRPMILDLNPVFWFNPSLETTRFLIPGLVALILIVTAVITVSLSLVREKERGTIEQLNVSSLNTIELLVGKALPYVLLSLVNAGLIIIAGYFVFGVSVAGSYLLLLLSTVIFLFACTCLGVFVSVVADSQQVAFTMATFMSLLPSVILSGFIFPIDTMPFLIQLITNITPAKFFIVALRAIMLKGAGLGAFWPQLVYMLLFSFVLLSLATIINKKKLAKE